MTKENLSNELRLKNIDKTRNYFIEEINKNELINKKNKKVSGILDYIEHLLILVSTVSGCVSISTSPSLVCILVGITRSAVRTTIYVITEALKAIGIEKEA